MSEFAGRQAGDQKDIIEHSAQTSTQLPALEENVATNGGRSTDEPYCIFPKWMKFTIVAMAAGASFLTTLTIYIYFPALNPIRKDLDISNELVNLTVTVFLIFQGVSPILWGSLSDQWGRRPVYISTIVIFVGSCTGMALAPTYQTFLALRMLQGFGGTSMSAVGIWKVLATNIQAKDLSLIAGAGIAGDITTPEERGSYVAIISVGQTLGVALGPAIGGIIAEKLSWRWIFWFLMIYGAAVLVMILFFQPETLRSLVGNGAQKYANPTPTQWLRRRIQVKQGKKVVPSAGREQYLRMPNVLQPLLFLLNKDVAVAMACYGLYSGVYQGLLTITPSLLNEIYQLGELKIGLCFLAQGLGCALNSVIGGRIFDRDFRITAAKTNLPPEKTKRGNLAPEFPIFEARLRTSWLYGVLMQIIVLAYGWCLHAHVNIAVVIALLAVCGFALIGVFNVFQLVMVDLFPSKGASATATNNLVRSTFGAVSTILMEPAIQSIGVAWTFTTLACILVASNALLLVLVRFGPKWREQRMLKQETRLSSI